MMNAEEAIAYIRTYSGEAGRPGLSRIRELLHRMGNPQNRLRFVHVAGGSGRGPACAALESVFRSAGYTTGLLLASSDSVRLSGRIRTDGCPIPDGDLAHVTEETAVLADAMEEHPTESELSTALAIQYFAEQGCEIVLLGAGMGGETDSTNVIDRPDAVLIMDVGPERTEDPEKSRMETAEANAAVIKQGCTAVCYPVSPEANRLFRKRIFPLWSLRRGKRRVSRFSGADGRLSFRMIFVRATRLLSSPQRRRFAVWDGSCPQPLYGRDSGQCTAPRSLRSRPAKRRRRTAERRKRTAECRKRTAKHRERILKRRKKTAERRKQTAAKPKKTATQRKRTAGRRKKTGKIVRSESGGREGGSDGGESACLYGA